MMDDAKLQKLNLGPDWIDLSFGEPKVVMDCLFKQLNRVGSSFKMPDLYDLPTWEYQPAAGNCELTKLLEKKYDAKVVVCNGAKQALAAVLYSFKQAGAKTVSYSSPFYPANPSIVKSLGLSVCDTDVSDVALITSPNNPDGKVTWAANIVDSTARKPTIHDAAYYTETYLPDGDFPIPLGSVQVFSLSKMYGLSGLRVGYAVFHNEKYYKEAVNYMEMSTAGVSMPSQSIALEVEKFFLNNPKYHQEFLKESRAAIKAARAELSKLDPEVLILEPCMSNSMFAWFKIGPRLDANAAKVFILEGTMFGKPGYMRMNIAHPPDVISEAVSRLNNTKI